MFGWRWRFVSWFSWCGWFVCWFSWCWRFVCWLSRCRRFVCRFLLRSRVVSRFFLIALLWWWVVRWGGPSWWWSMNHMYWWGVIRLVYQNRELMVWQGHVFYCRGGLVLSSVSSIRVGWLKTEALLYNSQDLSALLTSGGGGK